MRVITVRRSLVSRQREIRAALFQTVEQAGDVRIARNHAVGDFPAGQPFGRAAQDAQHVVLRRREIFGFEHLEQAAGEHVRGAQQVEERCFLGRAGGPPSGLADWLAS